MEITKSTPVRLAAVASSSNGARNTDNEQSKNSETNASSHTSCSKSTGGVNTQSTVTTIVVSTAESLLTGLTAADELDSSLDEQPSQALLHVFTAESNANSNDSNKVALIEQHANAKSDVWMDHLDGISGTG